MTKKVLTLLLVTLQFTYGFQKESLQLDDIFELQYASDPQISPDGRYVVYRKMGHDKMNDRATGSLWIMKSDGSNHHKLTSREKSESSARWSPSGDRIAFVSSTDEGSEVFIYWMKGQQSAKISQLDQSPSSLTWTPDGKHLAFSMFVPSPAPVIAKIPAKPKGAKWAAQPRVTDRLKHEADGRGYMKPGFSHLFMMSAEGGAVRQLTSGDYNHRGQLSFSADAKRLYFSANRNENWEYDFRNSEIYSLNMDNLEISAITDRQGPDRMPKVSPDCQYIAYLSYEDKVQAHQSMKLHLMKLDGSEKMVLTDELDLDIKNMYWDANAGGLYLSYDENGNGKIGYIDLKKKFRTLASNVGGTTIGRPYASGSMSVSNQGTIVYTHSTPERPADLAIKRKNNKAPYLITQLNEDFFANRNLGQVEEIWYRSSFDQRPIQGWIVYPPNYDASKKYPFMVENHGGPISNYGDRFSFEMQLYAAAGYIVFYPNPRGSTSYGEEFANLLYHNYPGEDYIDVMDGVDACIAKGIAHEDQLFVAGGSAGGIMSAWMIGKNDRFEAAVVVKPVVNWISKTLVADNYYGYANTRFPGQPWENFEDYWNFSPLSLVENINTPTMVMVGMNDLRTPPSESKQLYHALKLRKVETVLVEIPEASHGIANRPSNLMTKIAHTLAWFERYTTL